MFVLFLSQGLTCLFYCCPRVSDVCFIVVPGSQGTRQRAPRPPRGHLRNEMSPLENHRSPCPTPPAPQAPAATLFGHPGAVAPTSGWWKVAGSLQSSTQPKTVESCIREASENRYTLFYKHHYRSPKHGESWE